jgi:hypothetical protein
MANEGRTMITREQAAEVAHALGIEFASAEFDLDQFTRGMRVELEHGSRDPETDVTHDDPILTAKIAWAHLKEMPDYYERLAEMEGDEPPRREGAIAAHRWLDFETHNSK